MIASAIARDRAGYDAYDSGSLGDVSLEMIPYVVFRVLQELEPAAFGDRALEETGFFARADLPSGRHGVAWTRPTAVLDDGKHGSVRYMARTCGSCHTGRVRLADGSTRLLNGGSNPEMNVHLFNARLMNVLKERLGASGESAEYMDFRKRISASLETKPEDWYWGKDSRSVPPAAAALEVEAARVNLDRILATMREKNDRRLAGVAMLREVTYRKAANPPDLMGGAPGLVETSGLGSSALIPFVKPEQIPAVLPPGPSMADIPAVWKLDAHGYANWDATLRGFARSMTSSLAVVGDGEQIDIAQNARIQDFLPALPPEPYPFALDVAAIARGETIFLQACAGCHDASPGRSRDAQIFEVGTDSLRANAITPLTAKLMGGLIHKVCPSKRPECKFDNGETVVDPSSKRGYVAGALHGIWAQAPYLHNGSVPNLRQLLVPELRTVAPFLRGSISYDRENGGWEWDPATKDAMLRRGDVAVALNAGHGSAASPFAVDGRGNRVRIAWSVGAADKAVVDDLIAYLLSR